MSKWKLTDIKELQTYGKELISGGPLTDDRLEGVLRQTEIFENFSFVGPGSIMRVKRKQSAKKLKI